MPGKKKAADVGKMVDKQARTKKGKGAHAGSAAPAAGELDQRDSKQKSWLCTN